MNSEVLRSYQLSDAAMLAHAKATAGYLGKDLADFTAFDSTITAEYLARLKILLTQAEAGVSDSVIIDRQVQLSDEVNNKLQDCVGIIRSISYFVKKVFNSKAIHNEFGLNSFAEVKRSKDKMILFLRDYDKVANKYKDQLIEGGCRTELIEKIGVAYKALDQASQESDLYKGNRPVITQERIIKNNELWAKVREVINAAKVIYFNNMPKLKRYMVPKAGSRNQSVKVEPGDKLIGLGNGIDEDAFIEIKNTGKSALTFYVADSIEAELPENAVVLKAGESITVKAESISDGTYGLLLAYNHDANKSAFEAHLLE